MVWKTYVELSNGEEDWVQAKECFVRAFQDYPLYTHLIPDEKKRPEFLKKYLEAIYDVTVRNGNSILVCVKAIERDENPSVVVKNTVIGGVLFVPPASNGGGWECQRDEDFWDAYEKYNLKDIDFEAFKRIQAYEDWEYENVSKYVCNSSIPMWNGILCGIDPVYGGKGCGSLNYVDCLNILSKTKMEMYKMVKKSKSRKILRALLGKSISKKLRLSQENRTKTFSKSQKTTVLALSHSRRAVNFHKKNGFQHVAEFAYFFDDEKEKNQNHAFDVTVLLLCFDSATETEALREKFLTYVPTLPQETVRFFEDALGR